LAKSCAPPKENLALVECFQPGSHGACRIEAACDLARVLDEALRAFLSVLDRYTLADVVRRRTALRQVLKIAVR
jgi:Rrf2 family transcriptional regulator, nitric oxide-sensitive transcriptional repressor